MPGTFDVIEAFFNTENLARPQVGYGTYDETHGELKTYFKELRNRHFHDYKLTRALFDVFGGNLQAVKNLNYTDYQKPHIQALLPPIKAGYSQNYDFLVFFGTTTYEEGVKLVRAIHYADLACPITAHTKLCAMIDARATAKMSQAELQIYHNLRAEFERELAVLTQQ